MLCLHIQTGIIGVATKDNRSTLFEDEILLDNILDGNAVGSLADAIGAKDIEASFIIEGCLQVAITS